MNVQICLKFACKKVRFGNGTKIQRKLVPEHRCHHQNGPVTPVFKLTHHNLISYTWPGSVSTCGTFLEGGIVQASAGNNILLTLYRLSIWPCLSVFNPFSLLDMAID
ncbi:hypothetical protein AMECASPLE_022347 [Ameca splendens]|uniref:Uncharacterized protein n=1 Tax=Ameca splendens TaxID=208324 RepID=A0ABV0YFD7_9TELE